jgi:hypothetical protein
LSEQRRHELLPKPLPDPRRHQAQASGAQPRPDSPNHEHAQCFQKHELLSLLGQGRAAAAAALATTGVCGTTLLGTVNHGSQQRRRSGVGEGADQERDSTNPEEPSIYNMDLFRGKAGIERVTSQQ